MNGLPAVSGGLSVNCTIVGNPPASGKFAVGGGAVLRNCIVWGNRPSGAAEDSNYNSEECSFEYSCTHPLPEGAGNIDADPRFVDPLAGDYTLASSSPAFNAGSSDLYPGDPAAAVDLAGLPRERFGAIDMGCHERQTMDITEMSVTITSVGRTLALNETAEFNATFTAAEGREVELVWDWGDGTTSWVSATGRGEPVAVSASHAWRSWGSFDVVLTASVFGGKASATLVRAAVLVYDEPHVLYVSAVGGADTNDGQTWETAFRTIETAVRVAASGSTIFVADGDYETTEQLDLAKKLVVVGNEADPSAVVIRNVTTDSPGARVAWLGDAGSKLSGVTLTGGYLCYQNDLRTLPGGAAVYIAKGTVSNCVIRANTANAGWFHGGIVQLANDADAVLTDCLVADNYVQAGYSYGVASCSSKTSAARIRRCEFVGNYGGVGTYDNRAMPLYNAVAEDCHIHGNHGGRGSGGAVDSTLYRCRIVGNRSLDSAAAVQGCDAYDCLLVDNDLYNIFGNRANSGTVAVRGGGLYNCTVANNVVAGASGADLPIYGVGGGAKVFNSIVWNNGFTEADAFDPAEPIVVSNYTDDCTIAYTCTSPLPESGRRNIDADPLFRRGKNAWVLHDESPCVGAASTSATYFPKPALRTVDLRGNERISEHALDMGALEALSAPTLLIFR